jgi:Tol biopolymer transport system component
LPYISICSFNIANKSLRAILDARDLGITDLNTWVEFKSQSKDASKIAFLVAPIPQFGSPNKDTIYVLDTQTNLTRVVFDTHLNNDISGINRIAVSPDRPTMLFDAKARERSQVFQINSDGTGLKQITDGDLDTMFPFWSSDGKSFYTVVYDPNTTHTQLTLYNVEGEIIDSTSLEDVHLWGWVSE